jgi:low affinity Fe/Cu permease
LVARRLDDSGVGGKHRCGFHSPSETDGPTREENNMSKLFTRFAGWCAWAFGHPLAFILACLATAVWAMTGPVFNYSDTWQLVINTGTTVATFLMVFVLQHSQNRDSTAIQAKLDELIRSSEASNKLIRAERLTETEVEGLRS